MSFFAGYGFDVHRLVSGRTLILGGVKIPFPKGLEGHSDADVLSHAAADALLGAASLGDIGEHFPDDAPEFKGISSLCLLGRVAEKLSAKGLAPVNLDCTVIAEKPSIAAYRASMKKNIARVLGMSEERVNIKATTTEGLGFAGRGEGIAACAAALVTRRRKKDV